MLYDIFVNKNGKMLPQDHVAILIKSMLTHGDYWGNLGENLSKYITETSKKL